MWFSPNLTYPSVILFLTLYPTEVISVSLYYPPLLKKGVNKSFYTHFMSLSTQKKKKKTTTTTRLKYGISFSQFTNIKNIHKHEEHTPKKLIQIKSSNTIKIQTTDLSKYN